MLQSVCKEGNDILHRHRTTKVCAWLLVPTTYLELFPHREGLHQPQPEPEDEGHRVPEAAPIFQHCSEAAKTHPHIPVLLCLFYLPAWAGTYGGWRRAQERCVSTAETKLHEFAPSEFQARRRGNTKHNTDQTGV